MNLDFILPEKAAQVRSLFKKYKLDVPKYILPITTMADDDPMDLFRRRANQLIWMEIGSINCKLNKTKEDFIYLEKLKNLKEQIGCD